MTNAEAKAFAKDAKENGELNPQPRQKRKSTQDDDGDDDEESEEEGAHAMKKGKL